jgi:hypothetical protein
MALMVVVPCPHAAQAHDTQQPDNAGKVRLTVGVKQGVADQAIT